jgi:imidazole glycerol-phosphate synthase subunit HisH
MIAIINSGVANLRSVANAVERLGRSFAITTDPGTIEAADHVILPGVGHAQASMRKLAQLGLIPLIKGLKQPVLGICLGMQILFEHTEEGDTPCLGLMPGRVVKIQDHGFSLPHMGWNSLTWNEDSPLLRDVGQGSRVYFVHSYRAPINSTNLASAAYGETIPALVARNNFFGTQFHPERSGPVGSQILRNFLIL